MIVRVMDEAMCVQPRDMYWSVLGMMNNPWFRIVIHKEDDTLRFEHPTQPALMPGGWMERVKKSGGNLTNGQWGETINGEEPDHAAVEEEKVIKMTKDGVDRTVEIEELREHDKADNPWFVVNGEVYDGTAFLDGHPGGAQSIVSAAGLDATDEFMAIRTSPFHPLRPINS
jgi:nitrate reductase (NAD(P)H)